MLSVKRIQELMGDPADYADFIESIEDLPQILGEDSKKDCKKTVRKNKKK